MYQYEYEKIKFTRSTFKAFHGIIYSPDDFHKIIKQRANDGYRYIGYLPTVQTAEGLVFEVELIFEKEI